MSIVASQESVLQRDTRASFLFRMALDYDMRKTTTARLCLRKKKSKCYPERISLVSIKCFRNTKPVQVFAVSKWRSVF